jgi:hypothetical protein
MRLKVFFYIVIAISILIFGISYTIKFDTGMYCAESPVVRWKFAIYTGECDDETGCHFYKLEGTGILEYFGLKKITCYGEDIYSINKTSLNEGNLQDTLPNITKAMPNGFIREFSVDSSEIYDTKFENINGCKKGVDWKMYDKNWKLKSEWTKKYNIDSTQTCDFSAYTIVKKEYKNEKIFKIEVYFASSDESKEEPCGIWKYYDLNGNITKTIRYGKCDITNFRKK